MAGTTAGRLRIRSEQTQQDPEIEGSVEDPLPIVEFIDPGSVPRLSASDVLVGELPTSAPHKSYGGVPDRFLSELVRPGGDEIGAVAVLLVPAIPLRSRRSDLRELLQSLGAISDVAFVSLRMAHRSPGLRRPTAIVRLVLGQPPQPTRVSTVDPAEETEPFEVMLDAGVPWQIAALDPLRAQRIEQWKARTQARPLFEVAVLDPRDRPLSENAQVFSGRDITESGLQLQDDGGPARLGDRGPSPRAVLPGDVVGRASGRQVWTVVDDEAEDLAADPMTVMVIDPGPIDPWLLAMFLQSESAQLQFEVLLGPDGEPRRMSPSDLQRLFIPAALLDARIGPELQLLRETCEELLGNLKVEAEAVFSLTRTEDAVRQVTEVQRDAAQAQRLIGEVRDFRARAQQTLPHPLARVVRRLQMAERKENPREAYEELLGLAETSTIMLGAVFAAFRRHVGAEDDDEFVMWRQKVAQGGASMGHWLALARKGSELARRSDHAVGGLAHALRTSGPLLSALERLLEQRNDDAHGAVPRTPYEFQVRLDNLTPLTVDVLEGLAALTHGEFFYAEALEYQQSGTFTVVGRDLTGDHPDFAPWRRSIDEPLPTQQIHVTLGQETFSMGPYCRLIACSICMREELYYPDKTVGSTLRLRSLERGHGAQLTDPHLVHEVIGW